MTQLKICGLKPGDDLTFASHPVVTHTGIVFAPNSRRYVDPDRAADLARALAASSTVMGVFVDTPMDQVLDIARYVGLGGIQLHGKEGPEDCARAKAAGYEVWKALPAPRNAGHTAPFRQVLSSYTGVVDALLIDAPPPVNAAAGVTGGYGQPFDWTHLPALLAQPTEPLPPIWIAGGIRPDNVRRLFAHLHPAGVDVSSGVETEGRKSPEKILAMIEAVSPYA
ncbi:phosphoribosylanthranilate isomerase [Alicyclobacillus cycloheptanicus]|uniref:N-(5'-phosphoribosyl)anthranilate isomerase n=1 Tax=Alicyclobacillus cycloheptanicus TaxID=1457 RepID=A0ABT9XE19_9BACL|nr:phosphoribosylanthranilate isomerase [Alicyclobacillus cycloheptanicus]MDQ0188547.1 phosphoribosylanthranilate isomerase [Alicyclobacillus cycloheptanicus]WDM01232.1 phosphoribosylanthranilate isomerase [Alicyclobacillus cycloheptanicus]